MKIPKSPFKRIFRDIVLLKRMEQKDKTDGGIIIPVNQREDSAEGIVVDVGEGEWIKNKSTPNRTFRTGKYREMNVKIGDIVLFEDKRSYPISIGGEEYIAVREKTITAIMEKN